MNVSFPPQPFSTDNCHDGHQTSQRESHIRCHRCIAESCRFRCCVQLPLSFAEARPVREGTRLICVRVVVSYPRITAPVVRRTRIHVAASR